MKKIKIPNSEVQELLAGSTYTYPKYATQIINWANGNAQGTRPKMVGQMSDLIQEFEGTTMSEWKKWHRLRRTEGERPFWVREKKTPERRREEHRVKGTVSFFTGIGLMVFRRIINACSNTSITAGR